MTITMTPELRKAIAEAGSEPVRIVDPETNRTYLIVKSHDHPAGTPLHEADDEDEEAIVKQTYPSIDKSFGATGWDDPVMDEYNDYETRRP
jgi:hypothetical protein